MTQEPATPKAGRLSALAAIATRWREVVSPAGAARLWRVLSASADSGGLDPHKRALALRLGLAIAGVTIIAEQFFDLPQDLAEGRIDLLAATALIVVGAGLIAPARTTRLGLALLSAGLVYYAFSRWSTYQNHGWLTVWTVPVALAFGAQWWESERYQWYLRMTLGLVMIGAGAQKILAGTYLDGSYITFLSLFGSRTETLFAGLCGADMAMGACGWHRFLGAFIVVWQFLVGILLLAGLRNLGFLFIEIAFLAGAGLYADEMNFQALNIALLSVAFGYGMRRWLIVLCLSLVLIDAVGIGDLFDFVTGRGA